MKHSTHRTLFLCAIIVLTEASAFCGTAEFQPTVANKNSPPGKAPEGMVWIPGGEFSMGAAVSGKEVTKCRWLRMTRSLCTVLM